jgi:hypothetical protein
MASANPKQGTVDGFFGTFQVNPASSATFPIPMYTRMKFIAGGFIDICALAADLADVVLYQPAPAVGAWVTVRFINAGGTIYAICGAGNTITASAPVYSFTNGQIATTIGTGHLVGRSISDGTSGNPCVIIPVSGDSTTIVS